MIGKAIAKRSLDSAGLPSLVARLPQRRVQLSSKRSGCLHTNVRVTVCWDHRDEGRFGGWIDLIMSVQIMRTKRELPGQESAAKI
jgi:hypothetical protein